MDSLGALPDGWVVWNEEPDARVILAFRPDIFDSAAFPPACLPTITVAPGSSPNQRPGDHRHASSWYVALYLEPDVRVRSVDVTVDNRPTAIDRAVSIADRFVAGKIDYRGAYQQPRDAYLEKLDALTGECREA
ncbi:MAG: DUF5820 family protein [Halobacteriales archaeon]